LGAFPFEDAQGQIIAIGSGELHGLAIRTGRLTPLILTQPTDQFVPPGATAQFTAAGIGLAGVHYQWQFNGVNLSGETNALLTLSNVSSNEVGNYRALISTGAGSVMTTNATLTLLEAPTIDSVTPAPGSYTITSGISLFVTASANGTVQFPLQYQWFKGGTAIPDAGAASYGIAPTNATPLWQTNPVDGTYTVKVWNPAGTNEAGPWSIHYEPSFAAGTAVAWGANDEGQSEYPADLTNAISIAAGESHSVGVREDGSVVQWGYHWADVPGDLTNAMQVAAGYKHSLALRADGTVTAWGDAGAPNWVPTNLSGVKAVSAGEYHNVALLTNGTVVAWGTSLWGVTNVPANLTNVTAISAGTQHNLALKADGTVVAWGWNDVGQTNVPAGLSNVVAIAAGGMHSLALKSDGTVVGWGYGNDGQCTPPSDLTNAMAIAAGWRHSVALRNDGMVVSWGDDSDGQGTAPALLNQVKLLAAGGDHTIAAAFSPLVQYPVDVTKDLLLIYNTNSADSIFVKDYYLAHRPMVSGANVLGINCSTNETFLPEEYTNSVAELVQEWLAHNPTRRPQYVILFPDIPSRVNTNNTSGVYAYDIPGGPYPPHPQRESVQYHLHSLLTTNWQPFVTSLNLGDTNACRAYIDKLEYFGTNYSPGQLFISASKAGYANTNYYFDDTQPEYGSWRSNCYSGVIGVLQMNPSALVLYTNVPNGGTLSDHITNAINVAGFMSWGYHGYFNGTNADHSTNGTISFGGNSGWHVIETIESWNGVRTFSAGGRFLQWFSASAFGGTNFQNTPVGAVSHTDEPFLENINAPNILFGMWEGEKSFAISAWSSRRTPYFQAIGDPFTRK
jgi:hypothetical protein